MWGSLASIGVTADPSAATLSLRIRKWTAATSTGSLLIDVVIPMGRFKLPGALLTTKCHFKCNGRSSWSSVKINLKMVMKKIFRGVTEKSNDLEREREKPK